MPCGLEYRCSQREAQVLSRTVVPFLLLALLVLAANAIADENDESIHAIWHLSPTRLGSLPPFLAGEIGFQDSSTKPVEAHGKFVLGFPYQAGRGVQELAVMRR